jgi:hypothetical protein
MILDIPFEFQAPTELVIEETAVTGRALVKGIMLREGISSNQNVYTIPLMEKIVNQCIGLPVYFGTATKIDTNLGIRRDNMHADFEPNKVGRIIEAVFDPIKRVINYVAEIFNTAKFPHIVEEIKTGWGVSIKGNADAQLVMDKAKRIFYRIQKMICTSLQLLAPDVCLGQDEARVQCVEIQETFIIETPIMKPKTTYKINIEGATEVTFRY